MEADFDTFVGFHVLHFHTCRIKFVKCRIKVFTLLNPQCLYLTGAYSCLRVVLVFARQLSFFIFTIYIPCFMIVIVSWMSFWIDHKAVRKLNMSGKAF